MSVLPQENSASVMAQLGMDKNGAKEPLDGRGRASVIFLPLLFLDALLQDHYCMYWHCFCSYLSLSIIHPLVSKRFLVGYFFMGFVEFDLHPIYQSTIASGRKIDRRGLKAKVQIRSTVLVLRVAYRK